MEEKKQTQRKKPAFKPLDPEQVAMARELIQENHPLHQTPPDIVFPVFRPFKSCTRGDGQGLNEPLLEERADADTSPKSTKSQTKRAAQKKEKKAKVSKDELERDPYLVLGFGMVAYRNLLLTFIVLFSILSLMMVPALVSYNNGEGLVKPIKYGTYSLGNMGYSTSQCTSIPIGVGVLPAQCPYGYIAYIKSYGVNPIDISRKAFCDDVDGNRHCKARIQQSFAKTIFDQCLNKNDCTFDFTKTDLYGVDPTIDECSSDDAIFYMQYACHQTEDNLHSKYNAGTIISCMGVFACLFFLTVVYWLKGASKLMQLEWDVSTVTAGDFSVETTISKEQYSWFLENVFNPSDRGSGLSPGESLKRYMKREIEVQLTAYLKQKQQQHDIESSIKITEVKIADIVFAFNNAELIQLLRERGGHIMYQRFDKMREVENKISVLKNTKYGDLTRPVGAFITFEEEDSYLIAQEFKPTKSVNSNGEQESRKLMGEDVYFTAATEPTNILWENRHLTTRDRLKRSAYVIAFISLLIFISFSLIFLCKSYSVKVNQKYPAVDCSVTKRAYGNNLQKYAVKEHKDFYLQDGQEGKPLTGTLQCFCEDVKNTTGKTLKEVAKMSFDDVQVCKEYQEDISKSLMTSQLVSYMIVIINYTLRLVIIKLIMYIGKDTESEQTKLITNGVFVVQFFNTAILLLLVNANLNEQSSFLGWIFNRNLTDFNSVWFNDIGYTVVYAMLFNMVWPLCEFFAYFGLRCLYRVKDRGFSLNPNTTKKTTIQQYVEVYSGPVYFIHYKYSAILNVTYVTFMYGLGLPLLFPIAVGAFFILYVVEKTMIYYSYRAPPMYDEKLNSNVLTLMTYAPLLFCIFGYWMFSNKQLFKNDVQFVQNDSQPTPSGHVWTEVFKASGYEIGPSLPLIITFWFLLVTTIFRQSIYNVLGKLFHKQIRIGYLEIDEDLDNYYRTLDDHDRNWSIKEEENARDNLKMKILDDETLHKLKTTTLGRDHLDGIHTYDILANTLYIDDFQYFSPAIADREKFIIDDDEDEGNDEAQSDLVKMILNLAFMNEERAANFSFHKDAYKTQLKGMIGGMFKKQSESINRD